MTIYFTSVAEFSQEFAELLRDIPKVNKELHQSVANLLDIITQVEDQQKQIPASEMTKVAELSLQLLEQVNLLDQQKTQKVSALCFSLGVWFAKQQAILSNVELVVNGLAQAANSTQVKQELESLFEACTYLFAAFDERIKQDLDQSNPGRPWRVFLLNYGIISTRSHNLDLMESAFKTLEIYLPSEAAGFFQQGMKEMVRLDYPQHVRVVMEKYAKKHQ
jgi:hypothetical protein